ncbi:ankyrin repeat domain-containing protein [Candidatus Dependentiae bacterium]|nr:ankyrin repeat domain-containing protein [Candidatus Dependentiae bacterium]
MKIYLLALSLLVSATSFSMHRYVGKIYNYATGCYNKQLLEAAAAEDKDGVLNALEQGADVNYHKPCPPQKGSLKALFLNPEALNLDHILFRYHPGTALHSCAKNGNKEIASLLLKHGAKTTLTNHREEIPLFTAVAENQQEMLRFLLENTPDCLIKTKNCINALTYFSRGQGLHGKGRAKDLAFQLLTEYLKQKKLNALMSILLNKQKQQAYISTLPNDILTSIITYAVQTELEERLIAAVKCGNIQDAQLALAAGAHVNTRVKKTNYTGFGDLGLERAPTPLHLAVAQDNVPLVKLLLEYGADVNAKKRRSRTPLHRLHFAQKINDKLIQLLVDYGANPFIKVGILPIITEESISKRKQSTIALNDTALLPYFLPNILKKQEALVKILQSKLPYEVAQLIAQDMYHPLLPEACIQLVKEYKAQQQSTVTIEELHN